MITYLCMTAPIAVTAIVSWMRHPYAEGKEIEICRMKKRTVAFLLFASVLVTGLFYLILAALGTENLFFSTLSVTTSFLASALTFLRSPYYTLAYAPRTILC